MPATVGRVLARRRDGSAPRSATAGKCQHSREQDASAPHEHPVSYDNPPVRKQDQIVALLKAVEQAWNSGDPAAYARLFAPDAVYVTRSGALWHGRPAIEEGHAAALEGPLADTSLRLRPIHIAVPALSVAVAHVDVELSSETSATRAVATLVLTLNGTEWAILAAHASEVAAIH